MKISLITACYNSEETIRQTLESVKQQSYSSLEYIVIDGGSSDATLDIVEEYRDTISLLISEPDKGIYDALNKGISAANGDVIGFLHSDDTFSRHDSLSIVAAGIESFDAVYGDLNFVSAAAGGDRIVRKWRSTDFRTELLGRGWMPAHPTFYLRKNIYQKYGVFDLNYKISADYESILRYFSIPGFSCKYIPEVLVNMRVGGASNNSIRNSLKKLPEDYRALRKNKISHPVYAILMKKLSKIHQYF
ncbi:glycosyl transferase [Saccharospirillum sp. MSK14-1]|uniref:glycosyltransferase family 2 protein n=1 Tax=Saccharospirillum sp. MSK14-1 TaxID=1897632 RepID=UPI000D3A7965|nr:glycosyltransferase family 2 protein [Saccharospirillum sp. MSK14-1]PTY36328.1 glycosyl transferase [Saccharospirillum sp. MSK14-1]